MFGIVILFAIIFIISFANYWWGIFKSKEEKDSIEKFIRKFEIVSDEKEYKKLLQDSNIPIESLVLLADAYGKSGDYEKTINIYLVALKRVRGRDKKQYILSNLGRTYFKAGFLSRSSEVFLESLKLHPRNEESLRYLTVVYEKLKEYDRASEVLDALEELGAVVEKQKLYLQVLQISENSKLTNQKKEQKLEKIAQKERFLQRKYFEFMQQNRLNITKEKLEGLYLKNLTDLLWFMDDKWLDLTKSSKPILRQIAMAKGLLEYEKLENGIFAFDVLGVLKKEKNVKADLSFHYMCSDCKNVYPLYFYRCPNCLAIDKTEIQSSIIKANDEKNIPFL